MRHFSTGRRVRYLAPLAAAAAIGMGAWLPTLAASATPNLTPLSAEQILVRGQQAHVGALSGTIMWSANLGLPSDLTSLAGSGGVSSANSVGFNPIDLLSGTHTLEIWDNGSSQQRLALVDSALSETDLYHNGSVVWLWNSTSNKATRLVAAPGAADHSASPAPSSKDSTTPALTPDQVAARILATLGPSTTVTTATPATIAGRSAYVLSLAPLAGSPAATDSTIDHATIAVDSDTGLVLQVEVFTKSADPANPAVALDVHYSSLTIGSPSASEFDFTPPAGSTVTIEQVGGTSAPGASPTPAGTAGSGAPRPSVTGPPWAQIVTLPHLALGSSAKDVNALTTPVTGAFGTAQLLQTNVVNALVLPDGRVMAGFVTVGALEAAASSAG